MSERDTSSPDDPVRRDDHEGDGAARGAARMEAFADAVFAIAITLPVVEFEMPDLAGGSRHLVDELVALWPSYLGYGIAVAVIGLYWSHHHFSGAIYRTTGHYFLLATTLFLAAIGFIAFPARVFAESLVRVEGVAPAAQFLLASLALTQGSWLLKWRVGRITGHVDARLDPAYVTRLDRAYLVATLGLVGAVLVGLLYWPAGLALATIILLVFVRAPETPRYLGAAPEVESD